MRFVDICNNEYQEVIVWRVKSKKYYIIIDGYGLAVTDGWTCDRFIVYDDKRVAYDYPEHLPQYIKNKVLRLTHAGIIDNRQTNMVNNKILKEERQ